MAALPAGNGVLGGLRLCHSDQHLARMRGPAAVVFGTQGEHVSGRVTIRQGHGRVSHHGGSAL